MHLALNNLQRLICHKTQQTIAKLIILFTINDFFYTQLNHTKYCYLSLTIQLNISHLFVHS